MAEVFERFNIKWLSPSSLGTWRENPGLWGLKYLGGFRDEAGPGAWRGNAVEGAVHGLMRGMAIDEVKVQALDAFEATAMGEASDKAEKERAAIPAMIDVANSTKPDKPLLAFQTKVKHWLDGIDVPLIGYIDFIFEDNSVWDLKTTHQCPSSPKPAHVRQMAFYMAARGLDECTLWYVTSKKSAAYAVDAAMRDEGLEQMRRDALSLSRFLEGFASPEKALNALPMNTDHFFWTDEATAFLHQLEAA